MIVLGVVLAILGCIFGISILTDDRRRLGRCRRRLLDPRVRRARPSAAGEPGTNAARSSPAEVSAATVIARRTARSLASAVFARIRFHRMWCRIQQSERGMRHQPGIGLAERHVHLAATHPPRSRRTAVVPCGPGAWRSAADGPDRGPGFGSSRTRRARSPNEIRSARPARTPGRRPARRHRSHRPVVGC